MQSSLPRNRLFRFRYGKACGPSGGTQTRSDQTDLPACASAVIFTQSTIRHYGHVGSLPVVLRVHRQRRDDESIVVTIEPIKAAGRASFFCSRDSNYRTRREVRFFAFELLEGIRNCHVLSRANPHGPIPPEPNLKLVRYALNMPGINHLPQACRTLPKVAENDTRKAS